MSPSNIDILTHVVAPVLFVYLVSHKISRQFALYLFIGVFGLFYGYSTILRPTFLIMWNNLLWWVYRVPVWAFYGLHWICWQLIRGIRALAWFGFYVHFFGYGVKFILESVDKILIWVGDVLDESKEQGRKR
ncbi:hypothetical protein F5050DRAFT_1714335 [Lentinula boryana]|uniref:Uncharacterized protein n=1 Tax=Lentinula boryana TaxID=40481 RepID=A0ABQ8Q4Z4_9AGAR|nr:hypothetical protein F5050DRAFT_1714335 [Lentinula boryana]